MGVPAGFDKLLGDGRTDVAVINDNNPEPLQACETTVKLKLSAKRTGSHRLGLDLVAILDVSGSMSDKIGIMKEAMGFVIAKLTPNDRLSLVTFDSKADIKSKLEWMTTDSKPAAEEIVNNLNAGGSTNMTAGLKAGLNVIHTAGGDSNRVVAIVLLSDGQADNRESTLAVSIKDLPVYTFSFGFGCDHQLLQEIASKSHGGTFNDASTVDRLMDAFSQTLAGLHTVAARDVQLKLTPLSDSIIKEAVVCSYKTSFTPVGNDTSVTIPFGDLFDGENRWVTVILLLPLVDEEVTKEVLEISHNYKSILSGNQVSGQPATVSVDREENPVKRVINDVVTDDKRLETAKFIKQAVDFADAGKFDEAQEVLQEALEKLKEGYDGFDRLTQGLIEEVETIIDLTKEEDNTYAAQGRAYTLASLRSHELQRFSARGDVAKNRSYATPRMDTYLEQVKLYKEDPTKPLPTPEQDDLEEYISDPLAQYAGPVSKHLNEAIKSLLAIEKLFTKGG